MLLSKSFSGLITTAALVMLISACGDRSTAPEEKTIPTNNKVVTETTENAAASTLESTATPEPTVTPESTATLKTEVNLKTMITLKTTLGEIEIELDAKNAPVTVDNFLKYAKSGHYDGTIFHRVIPGFMIQGGGFASGMQQKPTNQPIPNEANNGLLNNEFTIAMARTPDPHSASSQFFINVNDNASLNFSSETPNGWGYAVFGKVTNGQDVVKSIEVVTTGRSGPHGDVPEEDVIIESVTVAE